MRVWDRRVLLSLAAALVLVGMAFATPSRASAACGGGGFGEPGDNDYARRAGRIADTIILGRLIDIDQHANNAIHFELLEVYRGQPLASPIDNTFEPNNRVGIIHVGSCSRGEGVKPGGLFIYATGPRAARFGPMQLVFPRIPHRGWIINHCCDYGTLDELLVLLGVLPATSTASSIQVGSAQQPSNLVDLALGFAGLTALLYLAFARRSDVVASRPGP